MAKKVEINDIQDEDMVVRLIRRAQLKGWARVHIGQPVHWPEVNAFLYAAEGKYLTVSRPEDETLPAREWLYRQNYWFSDKNVAFEFKMRFG
jgi:hypothetical protein